MSRYSTNRAAKKLGIHTDTLAHYVAVGKVPSPEVIIVGKSRRVVHAWSEEEIEVVRKLLPKIKNGRKTRYKKKQLANSNWQLAEAKAKPKAEKQPQTKRTVPHKQRKKK
jgi:hypothetical protein